jgi:thiol-disulfide isomerase/thioredoxin
VAELGAAAPALQIATWAKGKAVDLAAGKGKAVHVVEFWATWCPPCRASIPHLTELQNKFKDRNVIFIGVSDEPASTVKKFVAQMGDKMDYTVAVDKSRKTSEAYMEAFGVNGIPHAFIVDKEGRIAWHGHPMDNLESVLQAVLDGKHDLAASRKRDQAKKLYQEFFELSLKDENPARADELARKLEALDKDLGGIEAGETFDAAKVRKTARFRGAMMAYQQALFEGQNRAEVDKLAAKAEALAPANMNFQEMKQGLEFRVLYQEYRKSVLADGDAAKTPALAGELAAAKPKNAILLNECAWNLLTDEKIKRRDTKLALNLAQAAYDTCAGKDAAIVDTYARALFDNGQVQEAISQQKKAIDLCEDDGMKQQLRDTLANYQKKSGKKL